ncbi:hypothetical protein HBB16_13035 [Pseudonocardia sp. MCCB 268]|nr:hypothetical protein [Pseudonocardia cytotoxica]
MGDRDQGPSRSSLAPSASSSTAISRTWELLGAGELPITSSDALTAVGR